MSLELQKISSKQVEEIFGKAHESEIIDGELYWFYFDDKFKPVDARVTIGFSKDKKVSFKNINLLDDTFQVTVPNIKNQFKEASFIKEAVKSEVPHIVLFDYRLVDSKRGIDIYVKYDGEDIEKVKYVSVSTPKVTQVLTNK
ncbi:MAG: hypothetical protein IPM57_08515 [Oligoflexia bacterium]|nr:hypothetical protein [Oligoflexia bacterium]